MIENVNFPTLLKYLDENKEVGALSVRLNLSSGNIDPASHRGFPTPWNAFCYFGKLESLFGNLPVLGRIFGGYHMYYKGLTTVHEVDAITGAFFLTRKSLLNEVKGFDETFFMYGEDLDLAYRIKQKGFKIIYYPIYTTLHLKNVSGIKGKDSEVRKKTRRHFFEAMKIFYKKHYINKYPTLITKIVFLFIDYKINHI
jgi:GT2 family glycosyltransferase